MFSVSKNFTFFSSLLKASFSNQIKSCDVCIVGGGPVGFGLASLLSTSKLFKNKKILIIESQSIKKYEPSNVYSSRTVALSPASKKILTNCGAWKFIEEGQYKPVKKMFIWEQTSESFITFDNDKAPEKDLAYIIQNDFLQHSIMESLKERTNVEAIFGTRVDNLELKKSYNYLELSDGSKIEASLLVGADGFNSKVRQSAKIKTMEKKYDQKAIVCVVKFKNSTSNDTAWQRFTKNGPIAYLPMDTEHSNLIWSTNTKHADYLLELDEESFVNELNKEIFTDIHCKQESQWLPFNFVESNIEVSKRQLPCQVECIQKGNKRFSFPLGFMHANHYVSPGVVLVGDACHRILPLAGQGVNLGFGDVDALVRVLEQAVEHGLQLGDLNNLQQYETERQRYVLPVASTIQIIHELFISDFLPIKLSRALGLKTVNMLEPIKDIFLTGATEGKLSVFGNKFKI